ncbi:MAG: NAD(P)H-dependent oxidoreductase subunit E [Deltaproteobacteria bacterium]|jgi:NADH-quinone oxidoreductase subunit E|nr:NAD(P)H-dependent oxidoreductase subunit E [Deltaproteobacteria bacterium]
MTKTPDAEAGFCRPSEERVLEILDSYGNDPQQLIAALLDIQEASGRNYVDRRAAELASARLKVPLTQVYEILTFYSMFATEPRGRCVIELCESAPCHFQEAERVLSWFENALDVKCGETDADGVFTLSRTSCVGACDGGPAARVGDEVFVNLTRDKVARLVKSLREDDPASREGL